MTLDSGRLLGAICIIALVGGAHAQSGERLAIDGSTGVMPLATALAKSFQGKEPGMAVELGNGLGTQARLQALDEGKIDIALASHGLDVGALVRRGMAAHEVARVSVVFGANAGVPVAQVTSQQVCDLYSGNVANWRQLGGGDVEVAVRARPDTEVDTEVVRSGIGCLKDLKFAPSVKIMPRSGDMAAELAATVGAFGMTTMTVVEQSGGKVRALELNGVAPTAANVRSGAYPLIRQAYFVVKSPTPVVSRFLAFVRSEEGERVILANGALPVR